MAIGTDIRVKLSTRETWFTVPYLNLDRSALVQEVYDAQFFGDDEWNRRLSRSSGWRNNTVSVEMLGNRFQRVRIGQTQEERKVTVIGAKNVVWRAARLGLGRYACVASTIDLNRIGAGFPRT